MNELYAGERVYVAGPDGFYRGGGHERTALSEYVQSQGFEVTLPNRARQEERRKAQGKPAPAMGPENAPMTHEQRRARAQMIFDNCAESMNESNACIANLENYRGTQRDGGTTYEVGMAYAKGCRIYGYTRDKRPLREKLTCGAWTADAILDASGKPVPNLELPFAPCIVGACKIIAGTMQDLLEAYKADLEEEEKQRAVRGVSVKREEPCVTLPRGARPVVYVAASDRYDADAADRYEKMRALLAEAGFDAIFPTDAAPGVPLLQQNGSAYAKACNRFDHFQQHVRNCDIILADLGDYMGYEPQDDVAFECGMAFQLGKKCFAWMEDARNMAERVPNAGEASDFRDQAGMRIENFDAPLNLMFGSSYRIFGGSFAEAVRQLAAEAL